MLHGQVSDGTKLSVLQLRRHDPESNLKIYNMVLYSVKGTASKICELENEDDFKILHISKYGDSEMATAEKLLDVLQTQLTKELWKNDKILNMIPPDKWKRHGC